MSDWLKYINYCMLFIGCLILRFVKIFPNIEPIMFSSLPVAKKHGVGSAFLFSFLAVFLFDIITGSFGLWTFYTAIAYGCVMFFLSEWMRNKEANRTLFVGCSIVGTIMYDLITSLIFSWQFGQTIEATLIGQIPFTIYH